MKSVLTIAGSDCSGGAGIQADIKTITVHKMYAQSVITALTAQNTTGVYGISEISPEFVSAQLDAVFTDIYPDSIKIGMVFSEPIIDVIAKKLIKYNAKNIVLDPVMVATSGSSLTENAAIKALKEKLFPLADIITPNIPEAEYLSGMTLKTEDDIINAAYKIARNTKAGILIKGGHKVNDACDVFVKDNNVKIFKTKRIANPNTHGTGCTLSSAIACNLANGYTAYESIQNAKNYISGALGAMLDLGKGSGPLNHMY